jgi:hypothetical protein
MRSGHEEAAAGGRLGQTPLPESSDRWRKQCATPIPRNLADEPPAFPAGPGPEWHTPRGGPVAWWHSHRLATP